MSREPARMRDTASRPMPVGPQEDPSTGSSGLSYQLWLKQFHSEIYEELLLAPASDPKIVEVLQRVGLFHDVPRLQVFRTSGDGALAESALEWCAARQQSRSRSYRGIAIKGLPPSFKKLREEGILDLQEIPLLVQREGGRLPETDARSALLARFRIGRRHDGVAAFEETRRARIWKPDEIETLTVLAAAVGAAFEQRALLDDLRTRELETRALLDNCPGIVYLKDRTGRFIFGNKLLADYCGVPQIELAGRRNEDLFPAEWVDGLDEMDRLVLVEGERIDYDRQVPFGGKTFTIRVHRAPVIGDSGEIIGIVVFAEDKTELTELRRRLG
ncbi:MAG: PAS domain S-box protein [Candidatus Eisenbacteria bacterium]|nr:PAS domain S-box protein [Candidatus Eisenbacteria bacterium]